MPSLTKKIINGHPYYYLRECQRVAGKPKIVWTLYLGSPQRLVERLTRPEPAEVALYEFGASAACFDIARALDIAGTIDRHVPKRDSRGPSVGQYLLLAALNRCIAPRSKARLCDWYRQTVLRRLLPFTPAQLTSQRFWDNMERVSAEQIVAVERELSTTIVKRFDIDLRCLALDATNFFTFVDSFNDRAKLPQRGHGKEGRNNLRLLGLALLVTADGGVPLFHHTYAGNQHDSVTFGSVVDELASRCRLLAEGACDITLVFDKGNNSRDNLDACAEAPFHFVGSLVPTQHPRLLAVPRSRMQRIKDPRLPAVWAWRTRRKIFGATRTVLCTWNQGLYTAQVRTLRREIAKRRRKLERLQASLERRAERPTGKPATTESVQRKLEVILSGRHMKDLFSVKIRDRRACPSLSWSFRDTAWHKLCRTLLGKTIIFTDRDDWSDAELVLAYRSQHHVESAFRQMKDPHYLAFRPTFHWTDQKLRVHAFTCVVALTILSLIRRKLAKAGLHISTARTMEKLAAVQEVALLYPGPSETKEPFARTTLSRLDQEQQALVDALGIAALVAE